MCTRIASKFHYLSTSRRQRKKKNCNAGMLPFSVPAQWNITLNVNFLIVSNRKTQQIYESQNTGCPL